MNRQVSKPLEDLAVDVLDYMFVEWLIRRNLYSKFTANIARFSSIKRSPRSLIRDSICFILDTPAYSVSCLMSGFFPFDCTPEGFFFWSRQSLEWSAHIKSFSKNF